MPFLNLAGWKTVNKTDTATDYRVDAIYQPEPESCVKCGSANGLYGHGRRKQLIMDVPAHGKRVGVTIDRKRYRCRACGATFLQPVPEIADSGSMTKRLMKYIAQQSLTRTFSDIASDVGVDEKTVRNVFNLYTDHLDKTVRFQTPRVLGIDEVHLIGSARCVFVNVEGPQLIGMLEKRNKPDVVAFLQSLPEQERIKVVTIDMWKPYKDAANAVLPHAAVVVDRFHVVKMATGAVEAVRKNLRDSMNTTVRRTMMRSRYLLLKRATQLKPADLDILNDWTSKFPTLYHAYVAKELFMDIWELPTRADAEEAYGRWLSMLDLSVERHFKPLTTAMENWRNEVFNFWDHRYTNAATEALNGLIKIANRSGRGYSFRALRAKMLYGSKPFKTAFGSPVQVELIKPPDTYSITVTLPPGRADLTRDVLKIITAHMLKKQ